MKDPLDIPAKKCLSCKETKPIAEFQRKGHKRRICQDCVKDSACEYRTPKKNQEGRARWCREMIDANPRKFLWYRIKWAATARKLDFNLDVEDFVIPNFCEVLGIPISLSYPKTGGPRRPSPNSASVDRLDSSKGYVKGNIKIISHLANTIKSVGTAEQHEKVAAYMRRNGVE